MLNLIESGLLVKYAGDYKTPAHYSIVLTPCLNLYGSLLLVG